MRSWIWVDCDESHRKSACQCVTLLLHLKYSYPVQNMPTSKMRLNMSLPRDVREALTALAQRDDVTPTTKALQLIMLALEIEEDDLWNAIAEKRDTPNARYISHDEFWSQVL